MKLCLIDIRQATPNNPSSLFVLNYVRLAMMVLIASSYYFFTPDPTPFEQGFVIAATFLFAVSHFLHALERKRLDMFLSALDFVLATAFGWVFAGESNVYQIYYGIIGITLMLDNSDTRVVRIFWIVIALAWASDWIGQYVRTGEVTVANDLINLGFVAFANLVGSLIRHYRQSRIKIAELFEQLDHSHRELQEVHGQLSQYAQQVEELTATHERNRIAREIHDTVGHEMTALLVQLQAARKLQDRDLEQSRETLLRCEDLARDALQNVRLSVRTIHADNGVYVSQIASLRQLLAEFSQMTGMASSLNVEGDPSLVPLSLQPTLYRIVQESLTNAKRHGNADNASVRLACTSEQVVLEICDDGAGASDVVPGFGIGGMRERVTEQGGTLQVHGEEGDGFTVRVSFPLHQQTWRFGGERA
jgi:signal transduction histidine kinase